MQRCDELRRITEEHCKSASDETFEILADLAAEECKGDFSPENWRKSLLAVDS